MRRFERQVQHCGNAWVRRPVQQKPGTFLCGRAFIAQAFTELIKSEARSLERSSNVVHYAVGVHVFGTFFYLVG